MSAEGAILQACGDESMRQMVTPGLYLICATVLGDGCEDGLGRLASAKRRNARKMHWYDLTDRERVYALDAIASMSQWSTVVIASPLERVRQERARRKALEVLLAALEERGVSLLSLENRWFQEDRADIQFVNALRSRRAIHRIRVEHVAADCNPRLWVPDQVFGALGDVLCGTDVARWGDAWREIEGHVTLLDAPL